MRIRNERPPMFAEIDAAFNVAGKPVLFCWGDTVYNPENAAMSYVEAKRLITVPERA